MIRELHQENQHIGILSPKIEVHYSIQLEHLVYIDALVFSIKPRCQSLPIQDALAKPFPVIGINGIFF
jgi:hypothetical protein